MLPFTVSPCDGGEPFEVEAEPRDIYVWEKSNRGVTFERLQNSFVHLYGLAHVTLKRLGRIDPALPLDVFAATYNVTPGGAADDAEEADPTLPAR